MESCQQMLEEFCYRKASSKRNEIEMSLWVYIHTVRENLVVAVLVTFDFRALLPG
jgi:hypothetical protein